MDSQGIDRPLHAVSLYRTLCHRASGRMLVVAAIGLAILQFAIVGNDLYERNQLRFLGFAVGAVAVYWSVVSPIPWSWLCRRNAYRTRWKRVFHVFRRHLPVAIFSWFLLFGLLLLMAGAPGESINTVMMIWLVMLAIDLVTYGGMAFFPPERTYGILIIFRLVAAGAAFAIGSGIEVETISNTERTFYLWPLLSFALAAQWLVWEFNSCIHNRQYLGSAKAIHKRQLVGEVSASAASADVDTLYLMERLDDPPSDGDDSTRS